MLRWGMKPDVAYINSRSQRHAEGLNGAIEILVIQSVFIVPNSRRRVGHFVTHKPNSVIPGIRFDLICRCARTRPSDEGRPHAHCGGNGGKREVGGATYAILAIGGVVIYVAPPGMRRAPGVFV